jgi:hypothetical protein
MDHLDGTKKPWAEPKLVVHGDIEHITHVQNKGPGAGDGIVLANIGPIQNSS